MKTRMRALPSKRIHKTGEQTKTWILDKRAADIIVSVANSVSSALQWFIGITLRSAADRRSGGGGLSVRRPCSSSCGSGSAAA